MDRFFNARLRLMYVVVTSTSTNKPKDRNKDRRINGVYCVVGSAFVNVTSLRLDSYGCLDVIPKRDQYRGIRDSLNRVWHVSRTSTADRLFENSPFEALPLL